MILSHLLKFMNLSSLVVYRVSKSWFRVGYGYHKLGFGSGTGITLLFEPRYRVSSSNIRVSETLENLSKMINLFYFCEQVRGTMRQKLQYTFSKDLSNTFLTPFNSIRAISRSSIFHLIETVFKVNALLLAPKHYPDYPYGSQCFPI